MTIEVTNDGRVLETKEVDWDKYFLSLQVEIENIDRQIEFLQSRKDELTAKLQKKEEYENIKKWWPRVVEKLIIGNVTNWGKKKIYHLPTDEWYDTVEFDAERWDTYFKTEQDAIDAWFIHKK